MTSTIRPALVIFAVLSALTGVAYPLIVTGIGQALFPDQAAGSLIQREGQVVGSVGSVGLVGLVGSSLVGQHFSDPKYVWGRPSATGPYPNNATASSGSNQGPLNPALTEAVTGRIQALRAADPSNLAPVPVDLVTASASGLDPHVSVAAAMYQVARVAKARSLSEPLVQQLVNGHAEGRLFGLFGEPRVNVLRLNLALDAAQSAGQLKPTSKSVTSSGAP